MRKKPAAQPARDTRERILEAAIRQFSRCSYEQTGLRDIATDVGVDVAYVDRCFGSKENLFAEALRAAIGADHIFSSSGGELPAALARQAFAREDRRSRERAGPLDIVVRSLTSPKAASILRDYIVNDFVEPLSAKLRKPAQQRAALIAAFLAGVGILRNVLEIAPLRESGGGELEDLVASIIATIGTVAPAPRRT